MDRISGLNLAADHRLIVPVIRRHEYTVSLEQANAETTFAHCTLHVPWSSSVYRRLEADWNFITEAHGGPLFAAVPGNDRKLAKWASMWGFKHVATHTHLTHGQTDLIFRLD